VDPQEPTRGDVAEPSGTVEAPVGTSAKGDGGPSGGKKRRMSRRRKIVLIVIAAIIVVVIIASFVAAEAMSTNSSCNSCHEMNPYYESWSASSHKDAKCVECHIPPGFPNFVKAKVMSLNELWVHATGQHLPPFAVTREITRSSCLRCHQDGGPQTEGTTRFPHSNHAAVKCVDCHVRIVHSTVHPPYYVKPMLMARCLKCHSGQIGSPPSKCSTCHTQPHEVRGECSNCHGTNSFKEKAPTDHPLALTGGHGGVPCADCHIIKPGGPLIPGTSLGVPAGATCVSCHEVQHTGLTDCAQCHSIESFSPANFQHPQEGQHVPTGDRILTCQNCHPSSDYGQASCTNCHENGPPTGGE
jgi:nitrate/TMAO reductase-like tetraheme cytochrome c subunit